MTEEKMRGKSHETQLRHLSQSVRLQEAVHPRLVRLSIVSICLSVAIFTGWSAVTNINEVARAPGEIVPQGFQQVVQHFDGGIVREILVTEGQMVENGDLLVRLDGAGAQEDLDRAISQQTALLMQKERLQAFVDGREPDFSAIKGATPALVAEQMKVYGSMTGARGKEKMVIQDQVVQKRQYIGVLNSKLKTLQENMAIVQDKYDRIRELDERGSVAHIDYLEAKQELNSLKGESDKTRKEIMQAQSELREYEGRLSSMAAGHSDDAYQQLDVVVASLAQNSEIIAKQQERVNRLMVRAPVRGVIKGLAVNTIGGVVQPGQTLMEIVPLDKSLVVEARIPPQYIGNLKPGQPVQVKVSTYDFTRYGAVSGKLEAISATTFTGERGERFYRGRIVLDHSYVGKDRNANAVMPGMTVMADIITGQKTILEYLLKPIQRSLQTAFSER